MEYIDRKEGMYATEGVIDGMAEGCLGNLRSGILGLQRWKHGKTQKTPAKMVAKPLWMNAISNIVKAIVS